MKYFLVFGVPFLIVTALAISFLAGVFFIHQASENPESMFYWGWLASCIKSGQDAGIDRSLVLAYCDEFMRWAYSKDVYNKLDTDKWVWPPEPIGIPATGN